MSEQYLHSEVFKEYVKNELLKQSQNKNIDDELETLEAFKKFESDIKSDPSKLKVFKILQNKFATDEVYASKTKKTFVDAVMMLDLD